MKSLDAWRGADERPERVRLRYPWDFNNRLQPVRIRAGNSGNLSALACLVYNYYAGVSNPSSCAVPAQATTGNNGNVMGYDHLDNYWTSVSHTAAYTYDGVNRLTVAQATGNSTYNLDFIYTQDGSNGQFGNMSCLLNGHGATVGPCPQLTFSSSTNRITTSGYTYDAAGNMTNDSVHAYTWDAEGRLVKVDAGSTATYTYDALGQRVYGVVGANPEIFYMYDPAGNLLYATMTDGWGGDELTEPVAGRVLASYVNGQSDTYFKHANALGSWGLITAHDGSVPQDQLYYPWGQTWTSGHYLFESNWAAMSWYNAESDLFLTPARSYGSRLERWMSPDRLAGDVANPQSLNRYAYALNNPASMIDPSGLCSSDDADTVDDPTCRNCGGLGWVSDPACPGPGGGGGGSFPPPLGPGGGGGGNTGSCDPFTGKGCPGGSPPIPPLLPFPFPPGGNVTGGASCGGGGATNPLAITASGFLAGISGVQCQLCRARCDLWYATAAALTCGLPYAILEGTLATINVPAAIAGQVAIEIGVHIGVHTISSIGLHAAAEKCMEKFAEKKQGCYAASCGAVCGGGSMPGIQF